MASSRPGHTLNVPCHSNRPGAPYSFIYRGHTIWQHRLVRDRIPPISLPRCHSLICTAELSLTNLAYCPLSKYGIGYTGLLLSKRQVRPMAVSLCGYRYDISLDIILHFIPLQTEQKKLQTEFSGTQTTTTVKLQSLYHNCDSTTIRLRHDYDEKLTCSFFALVESRRMETGSAIHRSRIVVVS